MKQLLFITIMLLAPATYSPGTKAPQEQMVYICTGGSSKKYHTKSDCLGLKNCGGDIKKISVKKATEMGRKPCKICY